MRRRLARHRSRAGVSMSMLTHALQLTPYAAIASGILLGATIGVICYPN
jgi:hypothetical protein